MKIRTTRLINLPAILICMAVSFMSILPGCRKENKSASPDDEVLIAIGDSTLTMGYVLSRIPTGLEPADSANLFSSIVDSWMETMLLSEYASDNISDMEKIEQQVREFRNSLIIGHYKRMMREKRGSTVTDARVEDYFNNHGSEMLLDAPVIKGIYIKIPEDAESADDVRRWVRSATLASVDRLEKYGLKGAMQYDYFMDRWVDFRLIADQIPSRFPDPDAFVSSTTDYETVANGSVYLLHISDRQLSGTSMPREIADPLIRDILDADDRADADRHLFTSLYNKAAKEGRIRSPGYDPKTHQRKEPK